MKQKIDGARLADMLFYAREARSIAEGKSQSELQEQKTLKYALMYLVEVIGEAASQVSRPTRLQYPNIPWPSIIGMRNIIIHTYDLIDLDILWDTVQNDLPPLIAELDKIVSSTQG